MIAFDEAVRLARLQERVRAATYHELRKDGSHKSSEGAVSLAFNLPPVVSDERDPYWSLEVYSYVLCPDGRTETWIGKSAAHNQRSLNGEVVFALRQYEKTASNHLA